MYINPERTERVLSLGLLCMVAAFVLKLFGIPWTYAFFGLWSLAVLIYWRGARSKVSTVGKAVLVTGCDTGIGHSLALRLDQLGFRVFACCAYADERSAGTQALRRNGSQRLHVLQLDFNDDLQILEVYVRVTRLLARGEKLWALVNCEGTCWTHDAGQCLNINMYEKLCDYILLRTATIVRMFLPLVMHARGRIVTIGCTYRELSSWREDQHYLVSNSMFEDFDKCLRKQLKHRGVNVCRIELLSPNTSESHQDHWTPTWGKDITRSGCIFDQVVRNRGETDVSEVVEAHAKAVTDVFPLNRYFSSIPC
ncbi:LOW QUALITY PROTEIN: D-beta-hydroxybutyrate dehydrogenase, mitochondrial-like [Penaeus monodon]|uniref:LOW QUALITY PROTEIN: D-beta-hydroxybutyrate dehydrogenase, mitochondrial-like n=1 Tax=Penaeus monodon TaxID=6687 RepID=UPI0018A6EAF1|nr:LOW QUALITY PROTEIN: D-beta-hydroxybutyrate dehydrogenase, mitochondrial-like [Penaeus monodon]